MDGAGRLEVSQRSRAPKGDLKAAAVRAAVVLREHLGLFRVRAEPVLDREPRSRLVALIERHVPRRAGIAATVLLLLASAGFGVVKGGHLDEFGAAVSDSRNALANAIGFRITAVAIN